MKKPTILLYHFVAFVVGAIAIAGYFWYTIVHLPPAGAIAAVALIPVAVVYIIGFAIGCTISCVLWVIFRRR